MKFIAEEKTVCENDKDKAPAESEVIFAEETGGNDEHSTRQTQFRLA